MEKRYFHFFIFASFLVLLSQNLFAYDCFESGYYTYENDDNTTGAKVSYDALIGKNVYLSKGVKICDDATIGNGVVLQGNITIKKNYTITQKKGVKTFSIDTPAKLEQLAKKLKRERNKETINIEVADVLNKKRNKSFLSNYHLNYILPFYYDSIKHSDNRKQEELKFQISIKALLFENVFWGGDIYGAYTQKSFWQVYNKEDSSPFRETNFQPEVFMMFDPKLDTKYFNFYALKFGLIHQSNGQSTELSRSWNRAEVKAGFYYKNFEFGATVWHRFKEDPKDPTIKEDPRGDDNPDLIDYIGHGFAYGEYKNDYFATYLELGNGIFRNPQRGYVNFDLILKAYKTVQYLLYYYYGYNDSLIDYNHKVNKIGFGITIKKW